MGKLVLNVFGVIAWLFLFRLMKIESIVVINKPHMINVQIMEITKQISNRRGAS